MSERKQGAGNSRPQSESQPFAVYQIQHSFSAALRQTGADVADIQDLYGHTDPEVTQIYAPPTLAKHLSAIERLREEPSPAAPSPEISRKRLAVLAGSDFQNISKYGNNNNLRE